MAFAYVGHSYHKITHSTRWFIDLLEKQEETALFWDESWRGGPALNVQELLSYDRIFVFQPETIAFEIARLAPSKLIFIPMWDSAKGRGAHWWRAFQKSRLLNFSWSLHRRLRDWGLDSYHCQFFPDPSNYRQVTDFSACRGYFWHRRPEIGWDQIRQLASGTTWASFHLHLGADPGVGDIIPPRNDLSDHLNLKITHFTETRDPAGDPDDANIYFAPRIAEGIGMSFLEAMARGQCIVAVNAPSMSEYIEHEVNGLLYTYDKIKPLNFSRREILGREARRHIEVGFSGWQFDIQNRLPEILFSNRMDLESRTLEQTWLRSKPLSRKPLTAQPRVTVAVITLNAKATFERTLSSILGQTFTSLEIIVVDGGSNDGTQALIEQYQSQISNLLYERDCGPYDAMNKAAKIARGAYVIYMNAGDCFASPQAVSLAMNNAPDDADFVYGHHIYISTNGSENFGRAARFEQTWQRLSSGDLSQSWFSEIPCHQATFTRRSLLTSSGYHADEFKIVADKEFLFRHYLLGRNFHHCGETISVYGGGGMSMRRHRDHVTEWVKLGRRYGDPKKTGAFFLSKFPREFALMPIEPQKERRGLIRIIKRANHRRLKFQRRIKSILAMNVIQS